MAARVESGKAIPNEIMSFIMFNYLDGSSLLQSRLVCSRWKGLVDDVIERIWKRLQAEPAALALGLHKKMVALQQFVLQDRSLGNKGLKYLHLFRSLHDTLKTEYQFKDLTRCDVIKAGLMRQVHQYFQDQSLLLMWEQIRGIIDPRPHQVQILPSLSTPSEIREWICDDCNAPMLTMVEHFSLNGRGIRVLSDEIGRCTGLKVLQVANNCLCTLPDALIHLKQLRILELSNNEFAAFPLQLKMMPDSLLYMIEDNPVSESLEESS